MRFVGLLAFLAIAGCNWYSPDLAPSAPQEPAYSATEASAWWTQVYSVISGIQLVGLVATAAFAGLAWASNEHEKRMRLRAYLSLKNYRVTATPIPGTKDSEVEFSFEIPNGGATPAYNVTIKVAREVCTADAAATLIPNDPETGRFVVLQQSSMLYTFGLQLDEKESADFLAGKCAMGGAILIEYEDVFKKKRKLLCRMITYKDTDGSHKVKPCGVDEAT